MGAKRTSSCAPHLRPGLIVKSKSKLVSASKDQTPDRPRVKNWKEKEISEEKSSGGFWHVPKGSGLPSFCDIHLSLRSLSASASIALIGARQVRGRSPLGPVTASSERREKIPTGRPFQSPAALADLTCMHPRDQGPPLYPSPYPLPCLVPAPSSPLPVPLVPLVPPCSLARQWTSDEQAAGEIALLAGPHFVLRFRMLLAMSQARSSAPSPVAAACSSLGRPQRFSIAP